MFNIDKQSSFYKMLDTFKARLKAKTTATGVNLSTKRIDAIADRLHKKYPDLTDEAEHDKHLDELDEVQPFKEIAAFDDYERTKAARAAKDKADSKKDDKQDTPPPADEMPAWAKGLLDTVNSLKAEKEQQTMQQKLSSNEKLKGIDAKLYSKWQLPKSEEEIESFADEVIATYGHLIPKEAGEQQQTNNSSFVPGQQRQAPPAGSKKVDADVINFAKSKNEQAKAAPNNVQLIK